MSDAEVLACGCSLDSQVVCGACERCVDCTQGVCPVCGVDFGLRPTGLFLVAQIVEDE